jgi:hypothetical protein
MFGAVGVVAAIVAVALAAGCPGSGPTSYALTVRGSESAGYTVEGKPPGELFRAAFGGVIQWDITNAAGNGESVRLRLGDWEQTTTPDCPVDFTIGGGPGSCEATLPNIPNAETRSIAAYAEADPGDDNNPYMFYIEVGRAPEGQMKKVDPELQIDDFRIRTLIAAIVSALSFFLAWFFRRRTG